MLDKLDFQKKFELAVKQEIQNYQNSLNSILQSIRDIKESVESNKTECLENSAVLHSVQNIHSIENELLKSEVDKKFKSFDSRLNDFCKENAKIIDLCDEMKKIADQSSQKYLHIEKRFQEILTDLARIKSTISSNSKFIEEYTESLYRKVNDSIEKNKKEIIESPSKLEKVKQEIEAKLDSYKVDFEGVTREINVFKKENFITQKKLEQIYTLIERFKKPGGKI